MTPTAANRAMFGPRTKKKMHQPATTEPTAHSSVVGSLGIAPTGYARRDMYTHVSRGICQPTP